MLVLYWGFCFSWEGVGGSLFRFVKISNISACFRKQTIGILKSIFSRFREVQQKRNWCWKTVILENVSSVVKIADKSHRNVLLIGLIPV